MKISQELLPNDSSVFATNREQVRNLVHIIGKMKQLADGDVERAQAQARDSDELAAQLKLLGNVGAVQSSSGAWIQMQKGFGVLSRFVNGFYTVFVHINLLHYVVFNF